MAAQKISKSDAIRKMIAANPEMRNADIVRAMEEKYDTTVPASLVSNVRKKMEAGEGSDQPEDGGDTPRPRKPRLSKADAFNPFASLQSVGKLIDDVGGFDKFNSALETIDRLGGTGRVRKLVNMINKFNEKEGV